MTVSSVAEAARTLIRVQPDKAWVGEYRTISFEVPDDVHEIYSNPRNSMEQRIAARLHIFACAKVAIDGLMARPDLAEMEIDLSKPMKNLVPDRIQETMEEIMLRNLEKRSLPAITELMKRNKVNYTIDVFAVRRSRLFPRFPDPLGPSEGFEAEEDIPEDLREHAQHVYDEGRPQ